MELKIEYLPIKALRPYEKNTRKHQKKDVDNIAKSIEKYGMCDAIGIWGEQNIIVEGHGRMLACKQLGITEVPCVRLDHLTDEQRREYAIAHNATAELSEWDLDILPDELAELDFNGFDFDFGFEVNDQTEGVSYISELLEDEECMTNNGSLERDEFSVSFCFPKEYEEIIKSKIKEKTKEFYQQEIMKIMGVI